MNWEQALELVNEKAVAQINRRLGDVESAILRGAWQGQTYEQIADVLGYSASYFTRDVGPKLWKLLSQVLGETVSKTNFRAALERQWQQKAGEGAYKHLNQVLPSANGGLELLNQVQQPPPTHREQVTVPQQGSRRALEQLNSKFLIPILKSKIPNLLDWGEVVDVSSFYGRSSELATLEQWIQIENSRLLAILGMGGVGKTALAAKLGQQIQGDFEAVVWRSLRNAPPLETLLGELVPFLSEQQDTKAELRRLLYWLRASRCLLILDNVETILQSRDYAGQYRPGYENYGELFRLVGETVHQSCLLLTSREKPAEIAMFEGGGMKSSPVRSLQLGGSPEAAMALIQAQGLSGSAAQQKHLCELYDCNPLFLKIVANSIQELFDGKIAKFLAQNTLVFNGIRRALEQQFHRLSPVEQNIMKRLAISPEGLTIAELAEEIGVSFFRADVLGGLESLMWRALIEKTSPTLIHQQSSRYTQPSIVREYVNDRIIRQASEKLKLQSVSV